MLKKAAVALMAVLLVGCGNLSQVDENGRSESPVWPKAEDATFNHDGSQFGSWVNVDNLNTVERGMNKDQVQNLLGRPHFGEGLYGVSEFDYVFNYKDGAEVKQCQVKVLFDKNHNVGDIYRMPTDCLK